MIRTHYSSEITEKEFGKKATIAGWAQNIRVLGKISFIKLRDREGLSQVTIPADNPSFNAVKSITPESVLAVTGTVKESKQSQNGWEMIPDKLEVLSMADVPLPIDFSGKINTSLDKRIDYRYLDTRNPKNLLVFKVLSTTEQAMKEFCVKKGFMEINTPKFMAAASETGSELFEVKYLTKKAYLAQSPQLYKQMAIAAGFDKVFEQAPVFRANPSHTTRHDTEYTSFDVEIGFINSSEDVMKFEEEWLVYVFEKVKEKHGKEIKELFGFELEVPKTPFPRITMKEALKAVHGELKADKFGELDSEGEKKLGEYIKKNHGHDFVFLTEFPYAIRAFYIMKKDEVTSVGYDLLYKGLEITSGGQREHRHDVVVNQVKEKGIDPKSMELYLNIFKYGCPPHGGFGLSPTRVVMQILNLDNVRESTFLPRDTDRLTP